MLTVVKASLSASCKGICLNPSHILQAEWYWKVVWAGPHTDEGDLDRYMGGGQTNLVIVGVAILPEPESEELLVHIMRLLRCCMPLLIGILQPIPTPNPKSVEES